MSSKVGGTFEFWFDDLCQSFDVKALKPGKLVSGLLRRLGAALRRQRGGDDRLVCSASAYSPELDFVRYACCSNNKEILRKDTIARKIITEGGMADRLLVGVLGNRNAGKSHTWNTLFGRTVRRGKSLHRLELRPGECVETFLVSGSFEERGEYAGHILKNQDCRIVLCSMQYADDVHDTLDYLIDNGFFLYLQWLNPGYHDSGEVWDRLGLVHQILSVPSVFAIRNGKSAAEARVQEMREFIYGWARYRKLIFAC